MNTLLAGLRGLSNAYNMIHNTIKDIISKHIMIHNYTLTPCIYFIYIIYHYNLSTIIPL